MLIKIKTLKGEMTDLEVPNDCTLLGLKEKISETKSHPVTHVNIIFNGTVLNPDTKTLKELSLVSGSTVVLLVKPPKTQPAPAQQQPTQSSQPVQPAQPPQPTHPSQPPQPTQASQPSQPGGNLFELAEQAAANQNQAQVQGQPMNMQQAFTNVLQQNPEMFMQMLMQDPMIQQMAQANPQAFMQMIADPNFINNVIQAGQQMGEYDEEEEAMYQQYIGGQENQVQLTEAQKQELEEIVNMGLAPYEIVLQYYVAFGYDKVTTVNHLLNEQLDNMQ